MQEYTTVQQLYQHGRHLHNNNHNQSDYNFILEKNIVELKPMNEQLQMTNHDQ